MTLNVGGSVWASNVVVSNQVNSAVGYYSVQSGTTGISLAGTVPGPAGSTTIPLKNYGVAVISVYNSAATPVCYTVTYMVNQYGNPLLVSAASNTTLTYTVALTTSNITITNTASGSAYFFYNVTFFPIG